MTARAFIVGCRGLALDEAERAFLRAARPWGLILFRRNCAEPGQVRALVASFRDLLGRDAPVLIDQEGGRVQRLGPPHWRAFPAARRFGEVHERDAGTGLRLARLGARLIAADLADLGITVDCLPLLDLGRPETHAVIGDRAYAAEPDSVARLGRAVCDGLMEGGVLPVIKHIPGHGRATADSHEALPVVTASRQELEADFAPFRSLKDMPLAMTAHVLYTALDHRVATASPVVIRDVIRDDIGFDGLVMSDDLSMRALEGGFRERTRAVFAAGCDLALHCNGRLDEMEAVAAETPVLEGRALKRAETALARRAAPGPFDAEAAWRELESGLAALA